METRARYVLVGLFTLLSLAAGLAFLLWLARVEINRAFAQYDIVFDSVAGLSEASIVRYNGVDVGTVLAIALDAEDPSLVRVRIEINAATPVRKDTVARLSSQGVTGVSFVALEGGSPDSEQLVPVPPAEVPVITSQPSVVQELTDAAPDLLKEAIDLIEDIRGFTTPENRVAVTNILQNVQTLTSRIDTLSARLETAIAEAEETLARAGSALTAAESAFAGADGVIRTDLPALMAELKTAADDVGATAESLRRFVETGLPQYTGLATDAREVLDRIGTLVARISSDPGRFLLGNRTPDYRN